MSSVLQTAAPVAPSAAEVGAALERILRSRCFEQAGRASDFLRFVVEQTLAGQGRHLKGYVIATSVFGRPADFDPQSDPLVRVEAGRLRRRLAEYYATEGCDDAVRVSLPRGHYTPEWRYAQRGAARQLAAVSDSGTRAPPPRSSDTRWLRVGVALALAITFGALAWATLRLSPAPRAPDTTANEQLGTGDRVPIIVTPFDNLSGEPELERWAAAMTEEILLRLDQLDVLVIATPKVSAAATPMPSAGDSAYVLTGSIRTAGEQARITVRLMEAATGALLWSAAYNAPRDAAPLPVFHERMALEIAAAAAPYGPIYEAELQRARRAADPTPGLRDCFAAYYEYRRRPGTDSHTDALRCFESVTARRPEVASAWAGLALLYIDAVSFHFGEETAHSESLLTNARQAIDTAKGLEPTNSIAELANARLLFFVDEKAFLASAERALAMDPTGSETLADIGTLLAVSGHAERGVALVERAIELTNNPPGFYELAHAATFLREGRYDEALEAAQQIGAPNWYVMPMFVAAAAALAGRPEVAARARQRLAEVYPDVAERGPERLRRWRFDPALSAALTHGLVAAGVFPPATLSSIDP